MCRFLQGKLTAAQQSSRQCLHVPQRAHGDELNGAWIVVIARSFGCVAGLFWSSSYTRRPSHAGLQLRPYHTAILRASWGTNAARPTTPASYYTCAPSRGREVLAAGKSACASAFQASEAAQSAHRPAALTVQQRTSREHQPLTRLHCSSTGRCESITECRAARACGVPRCYGASALGAAVTECASCCVFANCAPNCSTL